MKLLGWLALGAGIFLIDSAVHNRRPITTLKLVLANGSDISHLPATAQPSPINPVTINGG